ILDRKGRVLAQLAAPPRRDPSWADVPASVSEEMQEVAEVCQFSPEQQAHTRGRYPSLSIGYMHGGGPKSPYNITFDYRGQEAAAERLLSHQGVRRLAGLGSGVYQTFSSRAFDRCAGVLDDIRARRPFLRTPFANSVFPAVTFNFGPRALTVPHRDSQNVPYGWCAVTALGNFDYHLGGHLVLWDLALVIEFPPESTILIPSALITHSNVAIQPGETRQSMTQWCAGALMRWHAYGYRTQATMRDQDP
ncbi:hypothetical protein FA95DRAFT_1463183, partial [Auriscalpium vulgare]